MIGSLPAFLMLAGRLLLACVFAFAGVAKLRDRNGTWSMLRAFGVGIVASDILAPVLPWIEIVTALALVLTSSARIGAFAALILLAVFSAAIAFNLANGRRPECRCFGNVGAEPVGPATIARNAVFAMLAVVTIIAPPSRMDPIAMNFLRDYGSVAGAIGLCTVVAVQMFLIWQILKQQGRMLRRIDDLEALAAFSDQREAGRLDSYLQLGQPAPRFELNDLNGATVTLEALCAAGRQVALFFVHPTCGPCRALVPDIVRWSGELAQTHTTIVISQGTPSENREFLPGLAPDAVLLQAGHEVADAFRAYGTPAAVIVDARGRIASELASGAHAVAKLLGVETLPGRPTNGRVSPTPLTVGSEAPAFSAPTTDGRTVHSNELRGTDAALIFWSPSCGFCRQAVDDLIRWERSSGLRLVVLSSAPDDDLIARGFQGPLAIDEGMRIGATFGASGTPMAVLIAADGSIFSEVAAGRGAIEALLQSSVRSVTN